ncbi:MAG: histidinol-phosphate transaminase [Lawsonibacter sp.]|nr:histidinol-phosphate transaminase [Lawsonibacter sp.]
MDKKYWSGRIQTLVPYTPGEQPRDRVFIKLNTNENPYSPSPKVLAAIQAATDDRLRLYPDPDAIDLRRAIADFYRVEPEQVFCGNGSDEVLGLCFYAFFTPGKKVVFPDITYSFYPVYTELFHLDYEQIPLNEDFTLPVEQFLGGNGGVVICNPNAPTGKTLPLENIQLILEANPDVVVMVDEAYADFGAQSAVPLLCQYPNLITIHTMSKSRSLAGMRLGYALGSPDLIAAVNCVKNSFNSYPIDQLALAAGTAAIQDVDYFEQTRRKVMATRASTTETLRTLGFLVHDSNANFIFIAHPDKSAAALQQDLRDRGILVRWFDKPRIRNYLRVSIGTDQEMASMCAACQEILKG